MFEYLKCMKTSKAKSTDCRHLSKDYLGCRMDKYALLLFSLCCTTCILFGDVCKKD